MDDNFYADVFKYILFTIYISAAALFALLGLPTNPLVPSPLSMDKFEAFYSHQRKLVGRHFDSRSLSVGMLPHKRDQLLELLRRWVALSSFDLPALAHLLGVLENHTKFARWARCWYFALQNHSRRILHAWYHIVERRYTREAREVILIRQLPVSLLHRLSSLIARDKARLLWSTRQRFSVDATFSEALHHLLAYVESSSSPWETPLGMIIPRDPHFWSRGDASLLGGGAFCPGLRFWFDISWSPTILHGVRSIKPGSPGFVHINSLEFIILILQLAAIHTRLSTSSHLEALTFFPSGVPDIPVWRGETDNTVSMSWENRATARTSQNQALVSVYSELLRTSLVHTQCTHLAGVLNT
ncbi:MAG: hypothetical protein ACRCYW_02690, partial [Aeromonas sp.]|uniref:hypothetical protein n=1 Tax=Aeromonas sp. TaxID=647 RepID=UPI003F3BCCB2